MGKRGGERRCHPTQIGDQGLDLYGATDAELRGGIQTRQIGAGDLIGQEGTLCRDTDLSPIASKGIGADRTAVENDLIGSYRNIPPVTANLRGTLRFCGDHTVCQEQALRRDDNIPSPRFDRLRGDRAIATEQQGFALRDQNIAGIATTGARCGNGGAVAQLYARRRNGDLAAIAWASRTTIVVCK